MSKKKDNKTIEEKIVDALNTQSNNMEKINATIQELTKLIKVTSHSDIGKILVELVKSDSQKIVYSHSDGKRTTKEFFEISGMYPADVSENWKKWARAGIAEQVAAQGGTRGKSLFNLEDFGIDVPKISSKSASTVTTTEKPKQEVKEVQQVE
jgi:hypothetical protein